MSIKLEITVESMDELRLYSNVHNYYNLIVDFAAALKQDRKHSGTVYSLQKVVNNFYDEFQNCANLEGPY